MKDDEMRVTISAAAMAWALAGAAAAQAQAPDRSVEPPAPATAPAPAPDADEEEAGAEVTVTGQRPYGSTIGNIRPEQELGAAEIRSYGVSSVAELLTELGPQTNAAAGPPVVLLNGKRISGFSEVRDIPPEAIQRVEILPEDVSLSYGYPANQKVVNIVLRRRFNAITGEVQGGATDDGARPGGRATANLLTLRNGGRLSLDGTYTASGQLLESDRDIVAASPVNPFSLAGNVTAVPGAVLDPTLPVAVATVPAGVIGRPALGAFTAGASASDLGRYRTLLPATDALTLNAVYAKPLSDKIQASVNARLEFTGSDALQGLPGVSLAVPAGTPFSPFAGPVQLYRYTDVAGALGQQVRGDTQHLGATLNGELGDWIWSLTGNYDRATTRTETERGLDATALQAAVAAGTANPFAAFSANQFGEVLTDTARSRSSNLTGDLLFSGPLLSLPAGKVQASVTVSGASGDFSSRSVRSGVPRTADFSRDIAGIKGSVDVPLASRRNRVWDAVGDLSLNFNGGVQHLSDAGTLSTLGYGLRWSPIVPVRFIGSVTHDRIPPTGTQINDPLVTTPNVPVFDYRTGETVFVQQIGGGNAGLTDSERRRIRLQLTVKPWTARDLTLTATFTDNRTDNPVASFPIPTPQIEAAFPGRFVRDGTGRLTQIDARPLNFDRAHDQQLRWGFNFSKPLKSGLQKKIEAWRAAGAKPEDRPAELSALRDLFQRERGRQQRERGQRDGQAGGAPDGAAPGGGSDQQPGSEQGGERRKGGFGGRGEGGGGFGGRGPGGGGFGGGGFGGGGRGGGGRLQFALFHTWRLADTIEIAPGVPVLDLLDGAAIGSNGGQSRHELEAQAGYTNNGIGVRLSANYRSATRVDGALGVPGGVPGGGSALRFGDLTTADLRLFVNFTQMPQLIAKHPFLRGSRLTLGVTNLFDAQQDVRDASGAVPLRYQPDYLDPLGRRFTIGFRKLFF